ncbi:hypothetical protein F5Y16DRAFT_399725 [Xylariaceae sp. FL0255]|nr:hypothetical protein F5Y16DRAFT_399725 [Xylariaceae sp. FL0255]
MDTIPGDRLGRLRILGEESGVLLPQYPSSPLPRPEHPPSYRSDNDVFVAEELLKRQRAADSDTQQSRGGLSRAFTTKKKSWEYKEIYGALYAHVTNAGSPGVAEALITRLNLLGGNLNLTQKSRTSLLSRRKSLDLAERSQILQVAVKNRHLEMVEVLLPYADALSLDTALPISMRNGTREITELLIRYGASASQTAAGQDAFRNACTSGGQPELIAMIMGSEGRPPASTVSQAMVEATKAGCLDTVMQLSQSTADSNHDRCAALKAAVDLGRRDIVLALILGRWPPQQPGINEAFEQLMRLQSINPNEKTAMAEILLCAGAGGDLVAEALIHASATYNLELVHLLVSYGASIEYHDAIALRKAVSKGKVDLVQVLMGGSSSLSPVHATECVELLPKNIPFADRFTFLECFLRKGAAGSSLDEALVDSSEAGDVESVRLLVTPEFPGAHTIENHDSRKPSRSKTPEGHEMASTDFKGALALQIAVKKGHIEISDLILTKKRPSPIAMAQVFPSTLNLPRPERYRIIDLFLRVGLSGPCVDSALSGVIEEQLPPHRDDKLIALFLRSTLDVNFNDGQSITSAIAQRDVPLIERLLSLKPTQQTVAKAVPKAMGLNDQRLRLQIINMLLMTGAALEGTQVSLALSEAIMTNPIDKELIKLLLQRGNADVNIDNGSLVECAAKHPDPEVLGLVIALGRPNEKSLEQALAVTGKLQTSSMKADKMKSILTILNRKQSSNTVNDMLIEEVKILLQTPDNRNLSTLKTLLANGADINHSKGESLGRVVAKADMQLLETLLTAPLQPDTLSWVMPHALRVQDSMDRLAFARKILDCGMLPNPANQALIHAVQKHPDDLPLINALLSRANTKDGMALIESIKTEKYEVTELILGKKSFSSDVLNIGFAEATKVKNKRIRSMSCNSLLKAGASGEVVSEALLTAASANDLDFGNMLVKNGGSAEHKNGQAIVEACKSGAVDVLEMLLGGNKKISESTLQRGFQAATQVGDLKKRAEIFKLLLGLGVSGDVVDIQLVSATRYGDEGKDLVRLLLKHGATPDFCDGEAVERAVRSAFLGNLELLLGIEDVGGDQKKPSSHTLVKGLDASWDLQRDTRFTVIEWIFRAGKPSPNAMHLALVRAITESEPEERLIRLLLSHGASPVVNGCQVLINATATVSPEMFGELLCDSRVRAGDASLTFAKAFQPSAVDTWLSERGLEIAKQLLIKGASGDGIGSILIVILKQHANAPQSLTNDFADLLLKHGADVNYNQGEALRLATKRGDAELLARLLCEKPNTESLTLAFAEIFDAQISEEEIYENIKIFAEYHDGQSQLDVMFAYPGSEPVIVRAMSQFPRSTKIVGALFDVGFYHEQMLRYRVIDEVEEEETVNILMWTLLQPQKKISTGVIDVLIDRGAKVNFETAISRVTPLMLAVRTRRQDVVKSLLVAGAEVDVTDILGNSPLSLASALNPKDLSIAIMSNLLAAGGASTNDGSLHNAARELNLQAMQVLVEYGHDPDFPSPLHGGRSALGELCLHAADTNDMTLKGEKAMERAIEFLLKSGSDITIQSGGKSVLLLSFESTNPLTTAKVLLRAALWKYMNKPFNQYNDGQYTYSPTMYVQRVLPDSDHKVELITLLRAYRGVDIYYANSGPQPSDAVGMPSHIELEEQERRSRADRLQKENEDHALAIQRNRELAAVQAQIWANQAELEEARKKRAHGADLAAIRERARVEEDIFNSALRQQREKQNTDLQHQDRLTKASVTRARAIGDAEMAVEGQKQTKLLQWERDMGNERVGNASQLSNIRLREREEIERFDKAADVRFKTRIGEQKKLVDSQTMLAANLNNGPGGRPPGFVRELGFE